MSPYPWIPWAGSAILGAVLSLPVRKWPGTSNLPGDTIGHRHYITDCVHQAPQQLAAVVALLDEGHNDPEGVAEHVADLCVRLVAGGHGPLENVQAPGFDGRFRGPRPVPSFRPPAACTAPRSWPAPASAGCPRTPGWGRTSSGRPADSKGQGPNGRLKLPTCASVKLAM